MGPYCKFCGHRCFVHDPRRAGYLLATCTKGQEHSRAELGYDYDQARAAAPDELTDQERELLDLADDVGEAVPADPDAVRDRDIADRMGVL